jgi:hypothetical protein
MRNRVHANYGLAKLALVILATSPLTTSAQSPVDDDGNVIGTYEQAPPASGERMVGNEDIPLMSEFDLEELVGPIALYPDDLLAIVLPASAYPLQIVDAARFLEDLERDPSSQPDPEWDDSVVALLNYPEVIELLNEDIDWTWRLGEAVVSQQQDVVTAIETFRDRAYAAGNLKSDAYQNVVRDKGVIEISPVADDVIYVPYYEPERVVVYQPRPVYYYYPRSYPVYYYPYSTAYDFDRGYFWGVTTAFTIGWLTDSLHVYHHSYHGHPYYGYSYWDRWWYRRPNINVYNTTYVNNTNITINRYYNGDRWRPRHNRREYIRDTRVASNRHYQPGLREQGTRTQTVRRQEPVTFRERPAQLRETTRHTQQRYETSATRRRDAGESVRQAPQTRPDARSQRGTEQRAPYRQVSPVRSETVRRASTQERREPVRQAARQEHREPVRQAARQDRREPVRQAARQDRREPVRQVAPQERREPVRQARQTSRESRPEKQRAENRTQASRDGSARQSRRRTQH